MITLPYSLCVVGSLPSHADIQIRIRGSWPVICLGVVLLCST